MRIVVIENNALVAMAMDDTLTDAGHLVVGIAGRVEIGTEIILKSRPDLLLVDLKLAKEATGADLIDAIREHVTIPTLFVSSAGNECRKLGYAYAYGCLQKPFTATQLLEAVAAVSLIAQGRKPGKLPTNLELYEPLGA